MSASDVAVMTSPRADVNKCKSGACRRVKNDVSAWKRVEVRGTRELWRRIVRWRLTAHVSSDGGQVSMRW